MFIMFALDLGELAYGSGEVVVLSKEVALVAAEGDAADLPISVVPDACCRCVKNLKEEQWHNGPQMNFSSNVNGK